MISSFIETWWGVKKAPLCLQPRMVFVYNKSLLSGARLLNTRFSRRKLVRSKLPIAIQSKSPRPIVSRGGWKLRDSKPGGHHFESRRQFPLLDGSNCHRNYKAFRKHANEATFVTGKSPREKVYWNDGCSFRMLIVWKLTFASTCLEEAHIEIIFHFYASKFSAPTKVSYNCTGPSGCIIGREREVKEVLY